MRCQTSEPLEGAQEVVRTQPGFPRQVSNSKPAITLALDHAYRPRNPRHGTRRCIVGIWQKIVSEPHRLGRDLQAELLPGEIGCLG